MKLNIEGHTDDVNDSIRNQKLSEQRAKTVMKYFITKGIQPDRLTAIGFGESVPIIENKTPETRATNRRVELKLHY